MKGKENGQKASPAYMLLMDPFQAFDSVALQDSKYVQPSTFQALCRQAFLHSARSLAKQKLECSPEADGCLMASLV